MAVTVLTVQTIKEGKGSPSTGDLAKTFTACSSAVDGAEYVALGREIVTAKNTSPDTPYDVTFKSVADPLLSRTGDITVEVAAGAEKQIVLPRAGFVNSQGKVGIGVENVAVQLNVSRVPSGF